MAMRKRDSRGLMESIEGDIEALADFVDAVATVGEYLLDTDDSERPIERKEHERELIAAGGRQWKCGHVTAAYVGSCKCGGTKQKDSKPYEYKDLTEAKPEKPAPTSGWICLCGKKNSNYNAYCSCGGVKADGTPYDDGQPSEQPSTEPAPEPIEEVIEIPEPVKIVLPQMEKPQGKRIEERTNKRFDNPFREEEKDWKCSRCGAIKPSFMPICECGMSKRDNG